MVFISPDDIISIREIAILEDRIEQAKKQIDQLEFNIDLYKRTIVSDIHNFTYVVPMKVLNHVWNNFHKEEKDDEYKKNYERIAELIRYDVIADTKCKYHKREIISDIIAKGYPTIKGYQVYFKCNEIEFILDLPNFENINLDDLSEDLNYNGKYALYYKLPKINSMTIIISSYNFDDLKKAFKQFIIDKDELTPEEKEEKAKRHEYYVNVVKPRKTKENKGDN